jgi:hypothetical protein
MMSVTPTRKITGSDDSAGSDDDGESSIVSLPVSCETAGAHADKSRNTIRKRLQNFVFIFFSLWLYI